MLLKNNPNVKVEIGGHADATGSKKANQMISEKRAQSAKKYIQDKFSVSRRPHAHQRLWKRETRMPMTRRKKVAPKKNRRVEFKTVP